MASARTLAWLDRLVWLLIYGGIFGLILGFATHQEHLVAGWSLGVLGGMAIAGGVVVFWVRTRLRETPPGAQSNHPTRSGRDPA